MAKERDSRVAQVAARRYWRDEDAQIVIDAWRQSGLSLVEFARTYGLQAKRLGRWTKRVDWPASGRAGRRR
jgi:hypothetical protein